MRHSPNCPDWFDTQHAPEACRARRDIRGHGPSGRFRTVHRDRAWAPVTNRPCRVSQRNGGRARLPGPTARLTWQHRVLMGTAEGLQSSPEKSVPLQPWRAEAAERTGPPEQNLSGWLKQEFFYDDSLHDISHKTIYRSLFNSRLVGLLKKELQAQPCRSLSPNEECRFRRTRPRRIQKPRPDLSTPFLEIAERPANV